MKGRGANMGIFAEIRNKTGSLFGLGERKREGLYLCTRCKEKKEWSEFYLRSKVSRKTGLKLKYSHCRACHREQRRIDYPRHRDRETDWNLRSKYGIGKEDYDLMLLEQGGTCKICNKEGHVRKKGSRKGKAGTKVPLSVDHNHDTGQIRGLLCLNCNTGIGHFKDSVTLIRKALEYLEETDEILDTNR